MARKPIRKPREDTKPKTSIVCKLPFLRSLGSTRMLAFTYVLILFLLPTLLLWSVTFGGKTLAPVDLLLVMSPWRHFAAERFPEFHAVKAPLLDVVQQYFPWRKFYAESLKEGKLPLWNPFMFCGTSFVGNGMSAIFYPLNLLFVVMPVETAFGWVAWLHLVLAGIFMFGFLRQFVSPLSALTGAIAFQLCGFFVAWLAYLPLLCTAVWLPAALWAYESGCRSYSNAYTLARLHAYILASLSLGMSLLAGHPQVGFYVLWAFGVYVLLRNLAARNIHLLLWGAFSLVGGVMFGAAQLLPLLEMASVSFRSGAESWALAAANRLPFDQFVRLFVPSFFGDWRSGTHLVWDFARFNFVERTGYPSVIAFLLAFVGLFSMWMQVCKSAVVQANSTQQEHLHSNVSVPRPSSPVPFVAGLVFATVGLLAASVPIVHRFMALGLPGTQAFVGVSRALFLFDFGIAILCAYGMEALAQSVAQSNRVSRLPIVGLVLALLLMAICVSLGVNAHAETAFHPLLHDFTMTQIYRWLALTTLGTIVIFLTVRLPQLSRTRDHILARLHTYTLLSLPLLVAIDLLWFAWGQHPEAEKGMAFFETPSIRWLKQNLGTQRFIAVGTDAIKHWTPSNTLMVYGLRDAQGSDSLMTMRIFQFLQAWDRNSPLHRAFAVRNFDSPMLDLMAVKYVVAAEPLSEDERKGVQLVHAGDLWVYENGDALPRAFVVPNWQFAKSPQDALQQIRDPNFDPRRKAVLEEAKDKRHSKPKGTNLTPHPPSSVPRPVPLRPSSLAQRPVRFRDDINTLSIDAALKSDGALVVVDGTYPGWLAFGREKGSQKWQQLTVFIADYAFRAVILPSGDWQVVWVYFPGSMVVGMFLSLTMLACFGFTMVQPLLRSRDTNKSGAGRI
jgi:hypothetical protein